MAKEVLKMRDEEAKLRENMKATATGAGRAIRLSDPVLTGNLLIVSIVVPFLV